MELYNRIKLLRVRKHLTQKDVSEQLGVSVMSVRNWETGVKNPSISSIMALAKLFNVSTDYMLGVESGLEGDIILDNDEIDFIIRYRLLDKYGKMALNALCDIEKKRMDSERLKPNFGYSDMVKHKSNHLRYIPRYTTPSAAGYAVPIDGEDFEMILVDENVPSDADFAVKIQGNSMYPYIHDGDTVYVKKDCKLSVGDVGIFCVDGAVYCKQYYIDDKKNLMLVSVNPKLKNTNIFIRHDNESSVKCYGKVLLGYKIELPEYLFDSASDNT